MQLQLQPYKRTTVGTLRSNKKQKTEERKNKRGRAIWISMICYDEWLTLSLFTPKADKTDDKNQVY